MGSSSAHERHFRIGIGGIAIESSTFSPNPSTLADFTILRGSDLAPRYPFMPQWDFHSRTDVTWLPCLHARAIPGGPVVRADYDAMKRELLERVHASLPFDGFYLDIHGAMSVLGMDDVEGGLAAALRAVVGPDCLISAGMDLHGNVSARLVENVDLFTAYRLAPHDDVMETRERACTNLLSCLDGHIRPLRAWVRIPVILPGERTSTLVEPGRSVYASLKESDPLPGVIDSSLWVGYVWADEPRSSATVVVTGTDAATIGREATKIAKRYWDARRDFGFVATAGPADWCIEQALSLNQTGVVISDSGDNPTAGGVGDVPYFISRMLASPRLASGERSAIYASIVDPAAVALCRRAGGGARVRVSLGGKLDPVHAQPLEVQGTVETLFPADPIAGDIAVLRIGGVHVIITSRRKPFHFVREMTELGLDPQEYHITAVKIGYLEPDLRRAARHALLALTPGAVDQDIPSLTYRRVQRPIFPLDPDMPDPDLSARIFGEHTLTQL
ncbi:MAG: M81 family metallopeptidase [Chloroflexi bacterium]|nr:M81 family metallopeptidase [Chloroflexota bacterium]